MLKGIIYGLHAGDGVIRYIGATTQSAKARLQGHRYAARKGIKHNEPKQRWVLDNIDRLTMEVLEVHEGIERRELVRLEALATNAARAAGADLLNRSIGDQPCHDTLELLSEVRSGRKHTKATRAKQSVAARGNTNYSEDAFAIGPHTRWHANRGVVKEGCNYCVTARH